MEIEVVSHQSQWSLEYKQEAEKISSILQEILVDIHHIGSTAVAGLPAKPVIDIMPIVTNIDMVDLLNEQFETLGYECMGEFGMDGRRYFRKGTNRRTHHVHIFEQENDRDWMRHLAVRDYLRTHSKESEAYGKLKQSLAASFPTDNERYCEGKDSFVKQMEKDAVAWYQNTIQVRPARLFDASAMLQIYAPYVKETAVTFDYEVPTLHQFKEKIATGMERYPYLVAEAGGRIIGYAYASPFKERAAYAWAVETTIYLDREERGKGVGRMLANKLEETLRQQNILNVNACLAYTDREDEHLTSASFLFHERMGYKKVAHFTQSGYKFNKWYDVIWMEKIIGRHDVQPKPVLLFSTLKKA